MTNHDATARSSARPVADLSESLDVRLAVAGRLSPTALEIHRDRAELAQVLGAGGRGTASAARRWARIATPNRSRPRRDLGPD
jgi:hypothetical protein